MWSGLKADSEGRPIVKECGSPVCKVCGKVVPAKGGNTSNLITHLRDHHPDKYSEAWPKVAKKVCSTKGKFVQPTLHELQERSMKYPSQSNITKELNSAVTFYLETGLAAIMSNIITEFEQVTDTGPSITPTQKVENELAFYLDFPMVSIDQNPLESWKTEQGRFPILAQLAKKYLCVCGGTSVPSERIFSKAGYINDHLRSRLLPKNVDKLVFLPKNMV